MFYLDVFFKGAVEVLEPPVAFPRKQAGLGPHLQFQLVLSRIYIYIFFHKSNSIRWGFKSLYLLLYVSMLRLTYARIVLVL